MQFLSVNSSLSAASIVPDFSVVTLSSSFVYRSLFFNFDRREINTTYNVKQFQQNFLLQRVNGIHRPSGECDVFPLRNFNFRVNRPNRKRTDTGFNLCQTNHVSSRYDVGMRVWGESSCDFIYAKQPQEVKISCTWDKCKQKIRATHLNARWGMGMLARLRDGRSFSMVKYLRGTVWTYRYTEVIDIHFIENPISN